MKYLMLLIPLFFFLSCKEGIDRKTINVKTKFKYEMIDNNCKEKIKFFDIDEKFLEKEFIKIEKKVNLAEIDRILQIFYFVEGEIAKTYNINIFFTKTGKVKSNLYLNGKLMKSKINNTFEMSSFYTYMNKLKDHSLITNRDLLIIETNLREKKCLILDNIKIKESKKILNLLFLNDLSG